MKILCLLIFTAIGAWAQCGSVTLNPFTGLLDCVGSGGSGSAAFSSLTSGTNTTAAMIVGSGASLTVSGTGTINATALNGTAFAGTSGNLVSFGAANIPADSGIATSAVVKGAAGLTTTGSIPFQSGTTGTLTQVTGLKWVSPLLSVPGGIVAGSNPGTTSSVADGDLVAVADLYYGYFNGSAQLVARGGNFTLQNAVLFGWSSGYPSQGSLTPDISLCRSAAGVVNIGTTTCNSNGTAALTASRYTAVLFANLATTFTTNGDSGYCSDCTVTSGSDDTCAGSGTGADVMRLNGVYRCRI